MTTLYTSHVEFGTLKGFMRMYMMLTGVPTKRYTLTLPKLDEPFGARFHFEKNFVREPVSVNVRVVLLVKDDTTLYTMVTNVSTKRWTLTLLKIDEPFGVQFHF
jgi:hypothetical protein